MGEIHKYLDVMIAEGIRKIVISKPVLKSNQEKKIVIEEKKDYFQLSKYVGKQVFHENINKENLSEVCENVIDKQFMQVNAWSDLGEYMLFISKKGKCSFKKNFTNEISFQSSITHNRKKNYIIEETADILPLIDMGIFTREGKVINSMYDKYKQINRYLEIIDDAVKDFQNDTINVIDFGCGKSYLTFVVYYYLTKIKKKNANIIGLDLKEDVIKKCNKAADEYGYKGLRFELGDINGYQAPFNVDIVMTLHACDTATDYALLNAIQWKAKMIFSVPCCQHELNKQIDAEELSILTRYGIIQERFSALATDVIRANLLEYSGYKTQLLEFIDFSHTPKNILIRAVKRKQTSQLQKEKMLIEVNNLMKEFKFMPTLYELLFRKRQIR